MVSGTEGNNAEVYSLIKDIGYFCWDQEVLVAIWPGFRLFAKADAYSRTFCTYGTITKKSAWNKRIPVSAPQCLCVGTFKPI